MSGLTGRKGLVSALEVTQKNHIDAELERICQSPEFRQSEQSKRMLRFLAERSASDQPESLRERSIGVELFGLESGYDTTENPIVRVRANEIRKRLTRYYLRETDTEVRLELPSGAYRIEFHWREPLVAPPASNPPPADRGQWLFAGLLLAVLAFGAWWQWGRGTPTTVVDHFWSPGLRAPGPLILCSGHPVVYRLSDEMQRRVRGDRFDHFRMQTDPLTLKPTDTFNGDALIAMPNQYIGLGSAVAVARVHAWMAAHNKPSDIRFGNDITFSDLRQSPVLVIGAFQNQWSQQFLNGLRFRFDTANGAPIVRDTASGRTWSVPDLNQNGTTPEDYVLITRVLRGPTGEFLVIGGGITQYGGSTLGEVLTRPAVLAEMLKDAPTGWQHRNLQLLLHVKVIGQTAGPPTPVALHVW